MPVRQVRVGDVLQQVRRTTPVVVDAKYPMVGARNFARGGFDAGTLEGSDTSYMHLQLVRPGDLIYPKLGAWEGAFAVVDQRLGDRFVSPEYCVFAPSSADVNPSYLRHLFGWDAFWRSVAAQSSGTNVRRRRLQPSDFLRAPLFLPDLREQERISARLDRVGAFEQPLSASQEVSRILDAMLADGQHRPLADLLRLDLDEHPIDRSATYSRVGVRNFGRGLFSQGELHGSETKYTKLRAVHTGQFVMSRLKAFEGAVAIAPPSFDGFVVSQEFVTLTARFEGDLPWLSALCRWPGLWEALRERSSGIGARRERVSADALLALPIPVPTRPARQRIASLHRSRTTLDDLERRRSTIRDALLPAARNEEFSRLT